MGNEARELTTYEIHRDIDRGVSFLGTLSRSPYIRRILAGRGYTGEEHQDGWNLLLAVMGWKPEPVDIASGGAVSQERAIAELDQWDGPNFTIARAALHRLHPDQESYIFQDLVALQGAAAVGSVKTYVDRVRALRDGTDSNRGSTRDEDRAAIATLEMRKVAGREIEENLFGLIDHATTAAPLPPDTGEVEYTDEYQNTARRLHDWLTDWRETARAVVTRGDYQIRLGLVNRRTNKPEEVEEVVVEEPPPIV